MTIDAMDYIKKLEAIVDNRDERIKHREGEIDRLKKIAEEAVERLRARSELSLGLAEAITRTRVLIDMLEANEKVQRSTTAKAVLRDVKQALRTTPKALEPGLKDST